MGQRITRQEINEALKIYNEQNHDEAVKKWQHILRKTSNASLKFQVLGHLAKACKDEGKYRDMVVHSIQQIDIANHRDSTNMRAEAYLNLARSNELLSEYHKAVSYGRHCLQNQPKDRRVHGFVYHCIASAYYGFSQYARSLENLDQALAIAKEQNDTGLQCDVYFGINRIFVTLKDYEKAQAFSRKAWEMVKFIEDREVASAYERLALLHMAVPHWKAGRYKEAMEYCEASMKIALAKGDRPLQAKCLSCFADIHRRMNELEEALPRYEAALAMFAETGDRYQQAEILLSMGKLMKVADKEEQALELYQKALEIAVAIRCKMQIFQCHQQMEQVYRTLGDMHRVDSEFDSWTQLVDDLEIKCPICDNIMGDTPDTLDTLPCNHIYHKGCTKNKLGTKFLQANARRESVHEVENGENGIGLQDPCPYCQRAAVRRRESILPPIQ